MLGVADPGERLLGAAEARPATLQTDVAPVPPVMTQVQPGPVVKGWTSTTDPFETVTGTTLSVML